MVEGLPLKLGGMYELVPCPSEDWPIVAFVDGKILYFNYLEELELDGKILRFHFPHHDLEFEYIAREWWKFIGMYGKEEIPE